MNEERTFKTKTGYCHILDDRIELTRDGLVGSVSNAVAGSSIWRFLIIYSVISVMLLWYAWDNMKSGKTIEGTFFLIIALFLVFGIVKSLNNSATPVIFRNAILSVRFHKPIPFLTRAYFSVLFTESGKSKKRLIMLPGSLTGGFGESEKAVAIMTKEGLLS